MNYEVTDRDKYTKELKDFIENTNKYINEQLACAKWSENSIQDASTSLICPFDTSHHLCEKTLEQHLEKCQWKAEGYGDSDTPLSIPSVSSNSPSCITFDEQLQEQILQLGKLQNPSMKMGTVGRLIPRTSDRLIADFTTEERKILYEYAIANTTQPDIGEDIADLNRPSKCDVNKPSSYLELLAQERNLKRRRAKHRGVHTNKKSDTEIIREVINQQMEMLTEYIAEKNICNTTSTAEYSSHNIEELKLKSNINYDEKKSIEANNFNFNDDRSHHDRVHRSINRDYEKNKRDVSKNYYDRVKHSKHRRKSSKERDRHRDRHVDEEKHDRSHKRHHSKHRHRDKDERHRSHDRKSSRHSKNKKKSKYD